MSCFEQQNVFIIDHHKNRHIHYQLCPSYHQDMWVLHDENSWIVGTTSFTNAQTESNFLLQNASKASKNKKSNAPKWTKSKLQHTSSASVSKWSNSRTQPKFIRKFAAIAAKSQKSIFPSVPKLKWSTDQSWRHKQNTTKSKRSRNPKWSRS